MRSRSRRVSLKDIAEASGVAVTTVSAALNRTGRISDSMRQRILAVSREMNYEPNLAAQLLKQKQCTDIGLIVSDNPDRIAGSGYFQAMIAGFIKFCDNAEIRCQIEYHNALEKADRVPNLLISGFAGGVLHGGHICAGTRQWIDENPDFPFVAYEQESAYSICSAYDKAAYEATQHLAALGHRRIAMVIGPQLYDMQRKPREGVLQAARDFELDLGGGRWIYESAMEGDQETVIDGVRYGMQMLEAADRPTAVLCFDARIAKGVLHAAATCNLEVPRDLSVIGFSSDTESEQMYPALTSVSWNAPDAVLQGYQMLKTLMDGRLPPSPTVEIRPTVTMRNTVARYSQCQAE